MLMLFEFLKTNNRGDLINLCKLITFSFHKRNNVTHALIYMYCMYVDMFNFLSLPNYTLETTIKYRYACTWHTFVSVRL